jgi:hypothetical protein
VSFIDFEYRALPTYNFGQQCLLDIDYLIASLLRRGAVLGRSEEFEDVLTRVLANSSLAPLVAEDAVDRTARARAA